MSGIPVLIGFPVNDVISRIIEERGKEGKGSQYTLIRECILRTYCYLGHILLLVRNTRQSAFDQHYIERDSRLLITLT